MSGCARRASGVPRGASGDIKPVPTYSAVKPCREQRGQRQQSRFDPSARCRPTSGESAGTGAAIGDPNRPSALATQPHRSDQIARSVFNALNSSRSRDRSALPFSGPVCRRYAGVRRHSAARIGPISRWPQPTSQIEHHLFPNLPRASLRHARRLVRACCVELRIRYHETSLIGSYTAVSVTPAPSAHHYAMHPAPKPARPTSPNCRPPPARSHRAAGRHE
jgi:hypothetical protein